MPAGSTGKDSRPSAFVPPLQSNRSSLWPSIEGSSVPRCATDVMGVTSTTAGLDMTWGHEARCTPFVLWPAHSYTRVHKAVLPCSHERGVPM